MSKKSVGSEQKIKRKVNGKNILLILLSVVTVVSLTVAFWALKAGRTPTNPRVSEQTTDTVEKLTDGIDLPGYVCFNLKADTKKQKLTIPNPPQNFCQIRISLILEDGNVIWTSELVKPGEETSPVVLNEALAKGEYGATIKYECFRMDEAMTPLNGAEANVRLKVK